MRLPFQNTYWVIEDKFMAGMYPGGFTEIAVLDRMLSLANHGIKTVVNLTHRDEEINYFSNSYSDECMKFEDIYCREFRHYRFSIKDMDIPNEVQMKDILDLIDLELKSNRGVYLHCIGGTGRTGTVVGCYLIRHGMADRENVFEKIRLLRKDGKQSPETKEQEAFIMNWKIGM